MNKNLIAVLAATTVTTAFAAVDISGDYRGTFTSGGPTTYAQDLDITLTGSTEGASVTTTFENLVGGDALTASELYVNTSIEGLDFKGGKFKGQKGSGLLQKKTDATNKIKLSTTVGGLAVSIKQGSGDSNASIDVSGEFAGVAVKVQNVLDASRFITAKASMGPLAFDVETQDTGAGVNTGIAVSTTVGTAETAVISTTAVFIDVNDAAGITQDNENNVEGILGDISDATTDVTGFVISTDTTLGTITGKYINKNDATTYVGKLKRGSMEYGYTKTDNTDGVFDAVLRFNF